MRTFLAHEIIDVPFAILSHGGSATRDNELLIKLLQSTESGVPLPRPDLEAIKLRPHIVADVLVNDGLVESQRNELSRVAPAILFRAMAIAPSKLYSKLAPILTNDPESLERLVVMAYEGRVTLPGEIADFIEPLRADPNRYWRVLTEEQREEQRTEIVARAQETAGAEAAFFMARVDKSMPLPSPGLFEQKEEYAYLLAKLLVGRGAPVESVAQYLNVIQTPRWIFHCLRDGLVTEANQNTSIRKLLNEPEWLVEWLHRCRIGPAERRSWLGECIKNNDTLRADLEIWKASASIRDFVKTAFVAVA